MRLIDADALKEYIDIHKGRPFIGCTIGESLKMMTDEQPTIEPLQRCIANITLNKEDLKRIVKEQVEEIKELLPQKGKWICTDDDIFNCSECDFEIDATGCIDPMEYLKTYNFCPNCGADMRGESDG